MRKGQTLPLASGAPGGPVSTGAVNQAAAGRCDRGRAQGCPAEQTARRRGGAGVGRPGGWADAPAAGCRAVWASSAVYGADGADGETALRGASVQPPGRRMQRTHGEKRWEHGTLQPMPTAK